MAFARFYRFLAAIALLVALGLSGAWLARDWLPAIPGELGCLAQGPALLAAPGAGLAALWLGNAPCGLPGALGATLAWIGEPWAPLALLPPALLALLVALRGGAVDLAGQLPAAPGLGSIAEVERRLGVGRHAARAQQDAQTAAGWRAVLLALLAPLALLGFRHLTPSPFAALAAAVALALLARSDGLRQRGPALGVGLAAGLGLLCDPWLDAAALWLPLLAVVFQRGELQRRARNALLALALAGALGGPAVWRAGRAVPERLAAARELDYAALFHGFGVPAALLLALGLLGLLLGRAGLGRALRLWWAGLLAPLPALALDSGAALLLLAPAAVLAGVGWGRSRVLLSPAGSSLLGALAGLALLGLAAASGFLPQAPGLFAFAADPYPVPHAPADSKALGWLRAEDGGVALDLVQAQDGWGGAWLRLLAGSALPVGAWPSEPGQGEAFLADPCAPPRILVLHRLEPWNHGEGLAAALPVGEDAARWREAFTRVERCYGVDGGEAAPDGGRVSFLRRVPAREAPTVAPR